MPSNYPPIHLRTKSKGITSLMLCSIFAFFLISCKTNGETENNETEKRNVFEIVATGHTFTAPKEVSSGWITFRLKNESEMVHFAAVERLPDSIGVEDQQKEVAPVFQKAMDLLHQGKMDSAMKEFGKLPKWYGEVVFMGGPGLVSPGRSAQATVFLEPGAYMLECYVKTGGIFHSYNPVPGAYGMVHEFTVIQGDSTSTAPPESTLSMTISKEHGITIADEKISSGIHTVALYFKDQGAHENFVGHDVHLVRLEENTDMEALSTWMDWTGLTGLETPAPAVFIGGLNEMPAGQTGYFSVNLEPGRYAWISEVPHPEEKGMLKIFTVSNSSGKNID